MKRKEFRRYNKDHVKAITSALKEVLNEGVYMDKAIQRVMKDNKLWGVKDRAFVSEMIYSVVRNWRLLSAATGIDKISEKGIYDVLAAELVLAQEDVPDIAAFKQINFDKLSQKIEKLAKVRKIRESYPDWIDSLCEKELGARWNKVAPALNEPPTIILRANYLKTNPRELQRILAEQNIESELIPWAPDALALRYSRNVFRTDAFKEGLFEVQDAASQMVSDFLDAAPGMRVVDACAGAGGKTLHLASIMRNKGRIIALDTKEYKLQELKKRAKRAGTSIIETRVIDSTKVIKRLKESSDRVLLDLPCSGLGVLRRNPDSKWKITPEEIERVKALQQELLISYSAMTKPGGKLVYATCSILPSEGEEQVQKFIGDNNDQWELEAEKRYWPGDFDCDGFYIALLKKKS